MSPALQPPTRTDETPRDGLPRPADARPSSSDPPDDPTTPSLARSYAITLAGSVGFIVFTLYTGIVSARLLAPEGRGVVGAIAAWAMMGAFIGGVGLSEGMSWLETRAKRSASSILTSALVSTTLLGLVTMTIAQLLIPLGFRAQSETVVFYARVSMVWLLPYMMYNLLSSIFGSRQHFGAVSAMRVGQPFLYAIGLTVAWSGGWAGVPQVLVLQALSFVVPAGLALWMLARESGFGRFSLSLTVDGARFGFRAFGSMLGSLANSRLDLLVLPAVLLAADIGLYVVATSAATMIVGLFGSLHMVVFPAAARAGGARAVEMAQRAIRLVLIASVTLAVVIGVLAGWLINLFYGAEFDGAVTPLRLLLPGVCCWATVAIVGSSLKAIGRPTAASAAQFIGVGVTVVGLALLLRPLGIAGAAITSTLSYATVLAAGLWMFVRASGTTLAATIGPRALADDARALVERSRGTTTSWLASRRHTPSGAADELVTMDDPDRRIEVREERVLRDRPLPDGRHSSAPPVLPVVGAVLTGLIVAWVVAGGVDLGSQSAVLLAGAPLAVGLAFLAISRFEWFVWTVLVVRPSLDAVGGGDGMGPGPMVSAMFLAIAVIWLVVQRRAGHWKRPGPLSVALGIFAGAIALSIVTSEMRIVSATAGLEILAGISMFLVLEQLLAGRADRLKRLVTAVLASAVIPVMVGFQQWLTGSGSATAGASRIDGTFVHPNPFATYLVLVMILGYCAAMATDGANRRLLFGFVAVLGLAVMLTQTRGGWIALVIAATYLGYRQRRWVPGAVLVLAAALVAFVPAVGDRLADLGDDDTWLPEGVPRNSLEWRFQYWGELIPLADESPITGIGPQVVLNSRPEALEPHNVFIQAYVELGLLGLGALMAVIVAAGVVLTRRRRIAHTRRERVYAEGATAAMLVVLVLLPSENLLNATINWWYLAACATWGFHARSASRFQRPSEPLDDFHIERPTTHGRDEGRRLAASSLPAR